MRQSGKLVAQVLSQLAAMAGEGVTLIDLDREAERLTRSYGAIPAFKGYLGFKHSLCTSVNEAIVHGVPSPRKLKDGDIVGLDFGLIYEGYYGDSAVTVPIGQITDAARKLMHTTRASLYAGIEACVVGKTLKDVARAIEGTIRPFGYGIVREFVGHGIGQKLHEDPQVPNYEAAAPNLALRAGMTIAIEPMVNEGKPGVKVLDDRWTAVTVDGKLSAHYEHTIAITENGPEILTDWEGVTFGDVPGFTLGSEPK